MFRFVSKVNGIARRATVSINTAQFGTYKTSTGLVGLAVDPNGRETLNGLTAKILSSVKRLPDDAAYRTEVEQWYQYIANVTSEKNDIRAIEDEIDLGQIEEVIEMAKNELQLIDFYYENHGADLVKEAKLEADELAIRMADSIYFSSPESRASVQAAQAAAAAAAANPAPAAPAAK
jgi:NADH dehydrogenase (ubiquinone) 1 alpha subcomplex subunit 5